MSDIAPELAMAEDRAQQAEKAIKNLQFHLNFLRTKAKGAEAGEVQRLTEENARLREQVKELTKELEVLEVQNGATLVPLPEPIRTPSVTSAHFSSTPTKKMHPVDESSAPPAKKLKKEVGKPAEVSPVVSPQPEKMEKKTADAGKAEKEEPKKKGPASGVGASSKGAGKASEPAPVDFSRLNVRVGRILKARQHPDASGLYIEEVDVGEETPRTICSGLVKFMPVDKLQGRIAIFCCNLKPAVLRGVPSQGMILCAETPDYCEIIDPPEGSQPGDRVTVPGYPGTPDAQLNPKRKVFERLRPDLRTNDECVATYKGIPFTVEGKGICKVQTLANSGIK